MKADDIRKYISELNIGSDDELAKLKKDFIGKMSENPDDLQGAVDTLEELSIEINERLAQVEDEDRAAVLERKLKLVEESSAELAELAKKVAAEPVKPRTVLIVDDSEECQGETKRTVPVALEADDVAANGKDTKSGDASAKGKDSKDNAGFSNSKNSKSDFFGRNSKSSSSTDDQKKLEKEAAELIKKSQKEQKEREQEQKKLEKEQQKQAAQKDDASSQNDSYTDSDDFDDADDTDAKPMDPRLAVALSQYFSKSYTEARESFKVLANAKNMSREDMGTAKFLYGQMLFMGNGGPVDQDAAWFWIKESAKLKNVDALISLGMHTTEETPTSKEHLVEIAAKALSYFKKADDAEEGGNELAKTRYIEVCEKAPVYLGARKRACSYCDALAAGMDDAYERKQMEDRKEAIRQNYKTNNASMYYGRGVWLKNGRDVCVIIGALLAIVADLFIFLTVQNKAEALPTLIKIDGTPSGGLDTVFEYLSLGISAIIEGAAMAISEFDAVFIMTGTMMSGFVLLLIGRFLMGFESYQGRGRLAEAVCEVSSMATLLTMFGNMVLYVFANGSLLYFGGAVGIGIVMLCIIAISAIIASPFRK